MPNYLAETVHAGMWTFRGHPGRAPTTPNSATARVAISIASGASRLGETVLWQIASLLPTPAISTLSRGVNAGPQHLGHQGQEDWAVAEEFDAKYQCTVQNTGGDDYVPKSLARRAPRGDLALPVETTADIHRELADAQEVDPRIHLRRRRSCLQVVRELSARPSEGEWEAVHTHEDLCGIQNDSEVHALDSDPFSQSSDSQWSVLGDMPVRGKKQQ